MLSFKKEKKKEQERDVGQMLWEANQNSVRVIKLHPLGTLNWPRISKTGFQVSLNIQG